MRLSWNEVRRRAANFAKDWKDAACGKGDTQSFYDEFFGVFGVRRWNVARYEAHVAKLDNLPLNLWRSRCEEARRRQMSTEFRGTSFPG